MPPDEPIAPGDKTDAGREGNPAGRRSGRIVTRRRAIRFLGAGAAGAAVLGGGGALWLKGVGRRMGRLSTDLSGRDGGAPAFAEDPAGAILDYRRHSAAGVPMPEMAIARGPDAAALARAVIRELGGMGRFVGRGDRVLVKPNVAWDRTPEQAANTNPEVIRALVELCVDAGASRVLVGDATVNDPRRAFDRSGIAAAARAGGATIVFAREKDLKELAVGGDMIRAWPFYMSFVEVDRVINVPVLKHHGSAGLTIGMKNWLGLIGGPRRHLHQKLHASIADLASFVRPTLTVVDAFRVMTGNGPSGGSLDDVKLLRTVAAAVDPVAADAFGARLMGWKPEDLDCVRLGEARGLGRIVLPAESIREVVL